MTTIRIKRFFTILTVGLLLFVTNGFVSSPSYADPSIAITGSIPPKNSDFQLSEVTDHTTTVPQNTTITYTITYGSHLYYTGKLTVEAHWGQGTIAGSSSPSVDGMNYVAGSANNAYGNTAPTIDLVNQKIDWTISSFPSQTTNQTVQFSLKTNSTYTGTNTVTFPLSFTISTPSFTTTAQTVSQTYQYNPSLAPTPVPATPTPTPTTTLTPTPTKQFYFTTINFRSVSPTSISLDVALNTDGMVTARYGTTSTNLSNQLTTETYATHHTIVLTNLSENTSYYVQLTAKTSTGLTTTSDMYVFHTGQLSEIPQVDVSSLSYIAKDIVLFAGKEHIALTPEKVSPSTFETPVVVIPQELVYTIRFKISKAENIKRIEAILRNKNVLGITSDQSEEPNTETTDLILTPDGYYQGRLKAPALAGLYEEFIRVYDTSGNITEQKIADIHTSSPIRVYSTTDKPIEAAQVLLYYKDSVTQDFRILPPQIFPVKNPSFTSPTGEIVVPLPAGTYKMHITALGFASRDVVFMLGSKPDQAYPLVHLTPQPFSMETTAFYYGTIALDTIADTKQYLLALSHSIRFFELNALIATALLVLLTFLAMISRLKIPLRHFPSYIKHFLTRAQHTNAIKGKLLDENKNPIPGASVYLLSTATNRILSHTLTSQEGDFLCAHVPDKNYAVEVMADGFEQTIVPAEKLALTEQPEIVITLKKVQSSLAIGKQALLFGNRTLALCFEVLLLLSLVFELSLGYTLGWEKTVVFLGFSIANLLLWIFHKVPTAQEVIKA